MLDGADNAWAKSSFSAMVIVRALTVSGSADADLDAARAPGVLDDRAKARLKIGHGAGSRTVALEEVMVH